MVQREPKCGQKHAEMARKMGRYRKRITRVWKKSGLAKYRRPDSSFGWVHKKLEKYASIWEGRLGQIEATEHRIDLMKGENPSKKCHIFRVLLCATRRLKQYKRNLD